MANIQTFLQNILSARYGKDVRQSIHDAIEEVDRVADTAQDSATEAAAQAEQYRNETEQLRNEVAEIVPEGYADLVEQVQENTVKVDTIIEKADLGIKETASGEEIHLIDSTEGKAVEFALYGKAKQNTTQGNQLLNYDAWKTVNTSKGTSVFENNGVTITATDNDAFTSFSATDFPEEAKIQVSEGEVVTLSWEEETNAGGGVFIFGNGVASQQVSASNSKVKKLSYTVPSGVTFLTFRFGVSNAGNTISYKNIMINKGATALPYEPFTNGASPNPQYPQPIEVSGESGSVVVKSCGKNLWNPLSKATNENGEERYGVIIPFGTYTITNNSDINLFFRPINTNVASGRVTAGSTKTQTFDTEMICWVASSVTDIQIEKGTKATQFEDYKETLATIPTENGLAGINDLRDKKVKYSDGSGENIQRIGKCKLSDLTWIYEPSANNKPRFISKDLIGIIEEPNASDYPNALCESYRVVRYAESFEKYTDKTMCIIFKTSGLHGQIWLNNTDFDNVEDLKNSLGDTLFYYQLAEPITTPLTAEEIAEIEKLHTFYPITNISNDFDCGMSVTYNADSKNYIDRMVAEQVASIVANMNN